MCSVQCGFKLTIGRQEDPWSRKLLMLLGTTAVASIVCLGGLASVQDTALARSNDGIIPGTDLSSKKGLRFYWYIMAWQLVIITYALYVVMSNQLAKHRGALVGLMSIAAFLYMLFTDFFYAWKSNPAWSDGVHKDRLNALMAGAVMTATLDSLSVLLLGWECPKVDSTEPAVEVAVK